jgi:hypothetical protein
VSSRPISLRLFFALLFGGALAGWLIVLTCVYLFVMR